ncbi:glycosyl hydrolase [Flavilitoribacter nigricans]|uniref:Glycosyl hydrolase n=1 Tax=Flavilitoribacter nigricans (strain ATCC 23147 / DSM 23189 / NBRC 102662 / NCIMB 1420 / SS-2) TaxID=1122177 RepID=A0A2D0ND48_FLAN2|nr:glycosyl hydrolase [Flavilitoribacter nigricans]PHN06296.1 glycosyl hydrolase [Flavilitoribacter nigricans DSM 23189 = NBRC 102662]
MKIKQALTLEDLKSSIHSFWDYSGAKIESIKNNYNASKGTPVFTVKGEYTTRGWTEWTQGFQFGSAILQFDATGDESFLEYGRKETVDKMASHVSHFGVHDHGFNNVSTYGNLLRLMREGRIPENAWEKDYYELALKISGAVQAKRWTDIPGGGYLYSFNGPHSLFVDTIRTVRALIVSHELGHELMGDNDVQVSLLGRSIQHAISTAKYAIYYGEGRDSYDEWGRTAHESIFNTNDGNFRCPNAQQGFSGFTTWTRGLAWAMVGFPEELEYLQTVSDDLLEPYGGRSELEAIYLKAARATCDFFIDNTAADGIPYWDTGAPQLHKLGNYTERDSDPYNDFEPIDSSAAAIGAQGLLRLGKYLEKTDPEAGKKYFQAGLTSLETLLQEPYLSKDPNHQGLILHSIYHEPNGWDYVPEGSKVANGESSMWGDYHARELVLYAQRLLEDKPYYTFYSCVK